MVLVYPNVDKTLLLQMAIKAMNDTLGPEGLFPSSIVFEEVPTVYTASETPQPRDNLRERAKMGHAARTEIQRIMAKMRVVRGLRNSVPLTENRTYDPGDQVLVRLEKIVNHRIGEGP